MVLGEVVISPNLSTVVARSSTQNMRTTYFSIINMGGNFAYAIGPWIGGIVLEKLGGFFLFLMLIFIAVIQGLSLNKVNQLYLAREKCIKRQAFL